MSIVQYNRKTSNSLLYNKDVSVIDSILERQVKICMPRGSRNGLTPGSQLEFEINNDQFIDPHSLTLSLTLSVTGGNGGTAGQKADQQNNKKKFSYC